MGKKRSNGLTELSSGYCSWASTDQCKRTKTASSIKQTFLMSLKSHTQLALSSEAVAIMPSLRDASTQPIFCAQ
jgi:hypothetical protein